jgi:hypothetical protein
MLKPNEKALISRELDRFFRTFHNTRTVDPAAQVYFVEDAAEYSFEAVMEAIARFRRGQVPDRNDDFAPSVSAFIKEVRSCQELIDVRDFWDKTDFLLIDSAEWKAICEAREVKSMPSVEYQGPRSDMRGKLGWYVEKIEVARAAPLIAIHRAEMRRIEQRGPLLLPALKRMGEE